MKFWKVYQNIYFTKGYNRTLVYDSLLNTIKFIPNEFYEVLQKNDFVITKKNIDPEYFNFLVENKYIFSEKKKVLKRFIKLKNDISINFDLGVCVIELSEKTGSNLYKLIENNNNYTRINQFNFIFGNFTTENSIINFVKFVNNYEVDLIELTFIDDFKFVDYLFTNLKELNRMFVINNFLDKNIVLNDEDNFFNNRMHSFTDVKSLKIYTSIFSFFESKKFNIYFYNKIFINRHSEIKNSKETDYIFGSLEYLTEIDINAIVNDEEFTKYWYTRKDETLVCKNCEFRNLCSDNRIPLLNINNTWIHDKECEYNPYISKWNDEEGYLSLKDSGISIQDGNLIINKEKLNKINETLWD